MFGIILAGGSGSRLWPLSRELYPKQLLTLEGKNSLLQDTFARLSMFIPAENIVTVTNIKHFNDVNYQIRKMYPSPTILSEPAAKNTAPAIACTLKYISQIAGTDEIVLITPADHLIKNTDKFAMSIKEGLEAAKADKIVTFGIKPTCPETGYGYIKTGEKLGNALSVTEFTEKPDLATATKYVEEGCYFWNSGMFAGKVSVLLEEFSKYAPEIFDAVNGADFTDRKFSYSVFEKMPSISIDYAIMEKSDKIALVPLASDWNDLGSWQSLYEVREKDFNGNVIEGNVIVKDVKNSFIYSSKKLVAAAGVEDLILVETEDAVLACKKDCSQNVKDIYEKLKETDDKTRLVHKTVFRPWGWYTCLADGDGYLTKIICVMPGQKLSIQSHNFRSEHWVVLEGKALVVLEDNRHELEPGQSIDIPVRAKHSLQNPFDEQVKIIEVQKGSYISEDDIIRYEDVYGRV